MNSTTHHGLSEQELRELADRHGIGLSVLSVASLAAGSGKSVLAAHLAIQAERTGMGPVVIMDTTARGALAEWWNRRKGKKPAMSSHRAAASIGDALDRLRAMGAKTVIIDTAPAMNDVVEQVIAASSVVLVPCRPEPKDLFAADSTSEVAMVLGRKSIFLVNRAIRQARMTEAITVELAKHGTVAPVTVLGRPVYRDAMERGSTVMETTGAEEAAAEIEQLWDYLAGRLPKDFARAI